MLLHLQISSLHRLDALQRWLLSYLLFDVFPESAEVVYLSGLFNYSGIGRFDPVNLLNKHWAHRL